VDEGIGGVQQAIGKAAPEFCGTLLDRGEARLVARVQFGARKPEGAQAVGQRLALRTGHARRALLRHAPIQREQALVGADARVERGDGRLGGGEGGAQFRAVGHRLQVDDHAPGVLQRLQGHVQYARQQLVVGRHAGQRGLLERLLAAFDQRRDGGRDVDGRDGVEARHGLVAEEGVAA